MSNEIEEKLREHTNFNKKQHQQINFLEKTPFEKELELKAIEMKNAKLHKQAQQQQKIHHSTERAGQQTAHASQKQS